MALTNHSIGKGRIIVLNGVSSSGKTSLAYTIQQMAAIPFYVVQQDAFEEMRWIPPARLSESARQR